MIFNVGKRKLLGVLGASVFVMSVSILAWPLMGNAALLVGLGAATGVILIVQLAAQKTVEQSLRQQIQEDSVDVKTTLLGTYQQLESYIALMQVLKPGVPFPRTRGWAAAPDFLRIVMEAIFREKPRLVLEASCGVSTLVIASALRCLGNGRVVSLEQDGRFASLTRDMIALHGLEAYATIIHAPLKEYDMSGAKKMWYDLGALNISQPIDLLCIDGPTAPDKHARYPALPLLKERLRPGALVILDDGCRAGEQEIVEQWDKEIGFESNEYLHLEKGAFVLRMQSACGGRP